jgi:hypothetical protein
MPFYSGFMSEKGGDRGRFHVDGIRHLRLRIIKRIIMKLIVLAGVFSP